MASALPESFPAFVVEKHGETVLREIRRLRTGDLPGGEVTVRVAWSSINYKDALAAVPSGRVARISPLVPGIDLAGTVVASDVTDVPIGSEVLAHGYELGVSRHGGFAAYARVPAGWIVPLPAGLTTREAMAIGTAGFTAAMSVVALEAHGLQPDAGPVLVTGASGGLGGLAVAILSERGYEVWAVTGKESAHGRLISLGAAGILARSELADESDRALDSERWAGAIDAVGGPVLPAILRSLRRGGAVAACGNAGGASFRTTVFPLILRGVSLLGMDSGYMAIEDRRRLWARLATDLRPRAVGLAASQIGLTELEEVLDRLLVGGADGRWIVRLAP